MPRRKEDVSGDIEFAMSRDISQEMKDVAMPEKFSNMTYFRGGQTCKKKRVKMNPNQINCPGKIYRDRKLIAAQLRGE